MRFNVPQYNPAPIESPQNALARGLDLQRAQQSNALQRMQMEAIQAQQMQAAQERARQEQQRAMMEQWRRSIPSPQMQASQQALAGGGGPTVGNAARMPAVDPRLQLLHGAVQAGAVDPLAYLNEAMPAPKGLKVKDYKAIRNADGSVSYVGLTEDGKVVQTGQQPFEKPDVRDFGGYVGGVDPITGKVARYGDKTQSPDSRASNAVQMRGQNLTDARQRERLAWEQGGGADLAGLDPSQAALVKRFGKPEAGRRWRPDGSMEPIPGGSADQKAQTGDVGRGSVNDIVASLRDMYNQLDESGGITNPERGLLGNVAAGVASSDAGQATGRLLGTSNQSLRNTIAQQRPLLLHAIMKATGMSARQLDSNAELKLYLSTATDPQLDVSANRRALEMIETLYGKGVSGKREGGASGSWDSPHGGPAVGAVEGGYRFKGGDAGNPASWEKVR